MAKRTHASLLFSVGTTFHCVHYLSAASRVCVCVCVCIYVCVCVFIHNTYSMSQLISVCRIRVCRSRDAGIDGWIILRLLLRSSKFFGFFSHHQIEKLVHKRFKEMEKPLLRKCEYSYKIYNNLTLTICKEWTLNFLILS